MEPSPIAFENITDGFIENGALCTIYVYDFD